MTETLFRDLFVELPRALFEALQGIAEQAVTRAHSDRSARTSVVGNVVSAMSRPVILDALRAKYGWRRAVITRSAMNASVELFVQLRCGHLHTFDVEEQAIERAARADYGVVDMLDARQHERSCTCIPRPT